MSSFTGSISLSARCSMMVQLFVGKIHVCIAYKTYATEINKSTSFTIDNMYYVNFRI